MAARALGWFLLAPALLLAADTPMLETRQHNFALFLFTPEGYRSMTVGGDEAHPVSRDQMDVKGLKIVAFAGDAAAQVKTILLSPEASFFSAEQRASGPGAVRLIRDDYEVTGEDWTYQHEGEKVSIRRHVHVLFKQQLTGLLK